MRSESKITLNNTDETLVITDVGGSVLDSVAYAVSTKNIPIEWSYLPPTCMVETVEEVVTTETVVPAAEATGTGISETSASGAIESETGVTV